MQDSSQLCNKNESSPDHFMYTLLYVFMWKVWNARYTVFVLPQNYVCDLMYNLNVRVLGLVLEHLRYLGSNISCSKKYVKDVIIKFYSIFMTTTWHILNKIFKPETYTIKINPVKSHYM